MKNSPAKSQSTVLDSKVRNLLRGAIASSSGKSFASTMKRIHRETREYDAKKISSVLLSGGLFKSFFNETEFPREAPYLAVGPEYEALRPDLEAYIYRRDLEKHVDRIRHAIDAIADLNEFAIRLDRDGVETRFERYFEDYGLSRTVALKAMSVRNTREGVEWRNAIHGPLRPYLHPKRDMGLAAFAGTSDPNRGYIKNRQSLVQLANARRIPRLAALTALEVLSPLNQRTFTLADRVQRFGREPLIDFVCHLMRLASILRVEGKQADSQNILDVIPSEVVDHWNGCFAFLDGARLDEFVDGKDQFRDLQTFSPLPAWSEYANLLEFRLAIERDFGSRMDYGANSSNDPYAMHGLEVSSCKEVAELDTSAASFSEWPYPASGFGRSLSFVRSIEVGALGQPETNDLAKMLDRTLDIPMLLSVEELDAFLPRRPDDKFYEYLRLALLEDADESPIRDHALRQSLQELLVERFSGDLLEFLKFVDSEDGHLSEHLYQTCTESFLGKLYMVFPKADDIVEAHTQLLEWKAKRHSDEDAAVQARSQRLLIRLRKVRGSIEETRLFVDPLWFMEWFHENQAENLKNLQPLAEEILDTPFSPYLTLDEANISVQPYGRLMGIMEQTYSEFCANKVHGAASYIGRRIRHGTFEGHLVVDIRPQVEEAIQHFRQANPTFSRKLKAWFNQYSEAVAEFAANRLNLRSRSRPDGLIISSLADPDKDTVATIAAGEIGQALCDNRPPSQLGSMLLDYCWVFIDADLRRAQDAIETLRRGHVLDANQFVGSGVAEEQQIVDCIRGINSEINQRFDRAKAWLTRPTNFSPRASVGLIVDAVADEIGQRYAVDFECIVPPSPSVDLIGHRFHLFYDALFILMCNAAEYGENPRVIINSHYSEDGDFVHVDTEVTSEIDAAKRQEQVQSINEAMTGEIGDAMDQNKKSGIRKLRSLEEESPEIEGFSCEHNDREVTFSLKLRYRLSHPAGLGDQ